MVAITLFIPNIFSRFCNACQIDCKLAKLVCIGWKMYKLAFHDHYSNNCSFRAKMTKRNGIKLTDRVLCRRRSTAIQSSCCLLILSQIYWKVVSLLGMLRLFTPFSLPQKGQRILFDFLPQELIGLNINCLVTVGWKYRFSKHVSWKLSARYFRIEWNSGIHWVSHGNFIRVNNTRPTNKQVRNNDRTYDLLHLEKFKSDHMPFASLRENKVLRRLKKLPKSNPTL